MLHSSLSLVRAASSCQEGVERAHANLLHIHRGEAEIQFTLSDVLECSGLDDAIWTLRAVPPLEASESEWIGRNFAADCVERT